MTVKVKVKSLKELEEILKPYHKCNNGTLWFSFPDGSYREFKRSMWCSAGKTIEVRKVRPGVYVQDKLCGSYIYLWYIEWLDVLPCHIELEGLE